MSEVLRHAEAITHHRDHALVDAAMVQSLLELVGKGGRRVVVRLYRVVRMDEQFQITLTAWTDDGEIRCDDIECNMAAAPAPMIRALTLGVPGFGLMPDERGRKLHFTWLPVIRDKELLACVELGTTAPLAPKHLLLMIGMRGLYANYLSLLHYSQIDTLTQLLNRKTFDDSLQRLLTEEGAKSLKLHAHERRRVAAEKANWLAVMDIDHFKRVNDTYGHLFGDEVLILAANVMRKVFRSKDKLFRFGGEEFVVLLRDTSETHAVSAFERFRRAIAQHEFPQLGHVTISIGVTRVRSIDNPTNLLGRADEALYYAKNHGRNQVQLYDNLEKEGKIAHASVVHTEVELF
jgi:diguanylate cyclase (GGDEF)-like protein